MTVWIVKGNEFAEKGEYLIAIEYYDKAIKVNLNDGYVWYEKGLALQKLGRNFEATICFNKAKELGFEL